jgi:beta-1,4-N-acetylglucosaminyltransferase
MNFQKIVSDIGRINQVEAEAAARRLASPTPTSKTTTFEAIASGHALDLVWGFLVPNLHYFAIALGISFLLLNYAFWRLTSVLTRGNPATAKKGSGKRPPPSEEHPTHLCVVLGSGGHTAEMLTMLRNYPSLLADYTYRTYIVSAGDSLSAIKASDFEKELAASEEETKSATEELPDVPSPPPKYDIITITRARRVHQSIFTTPMTVTLCLRDCLKVLSGTHKDQSHAASAHTSPDLILTNGPGTGVCVVVASIILLFFGAGGSSHDGAYHSSGEMRTIYIESWARVKTLSLSGWILKPLVDRFVVQWASLQRKEGEKERGGRAEFVGPLVV